MCIFSVVSEAAIVSFKASEFHMTSKVPHDLPKFLPLNNNLSKCALVLNGTGLYEVLYDQDKFASFRGFSIYFTL